MGTQVIGNYEIISTLGQGTSCKVYRAKDRRDGKTVALKVFRIPDSIKGAVRDQVRDRLERQIAAATTLECPGIIRLLDAFEQNGIYFLAMDLVEGTPVRQMLQLEGTLSVSKASNIVIPVAEGLDDAHIKGIIHRGVNCENILVQPDGGAKITPFSITELFAEQKLAQDKLAADGGSSSESEPVHDLRSDRFSLGCALYEMVSGSKPFGGDTQIVDGFPPRPAGIPDFLDAILKKALVDHPPARYQSGRQMASDLKDQYAPSLPKRPSDVQMCYIHRDLPGVVSCGKCGRKICRDCARYLRGKVMCPNCCASANRINDSVICSASSCFLGIASSAFLPGVLGAIGCFAAIVLGVLAITREEAARMAAYVGILSGFSGFSFRVFF